MTQVYNLEYSLDTYERGGCSGNISLRVMAADTNAVVAVDMCKCDLASVRKAMEHLYGEYGTVQVLKNTTSLFDYEFIHAEMQKELDGIIAREFAERKLIQDEQDKAMAEKVLDMLESQAFDDWYQAEFMDYVEGDFEGEHKDMKESIVKRLIQLLR